MKAISKFLVAFLILFQVVLLYAADQKVTVGLFESKADNDLAERAAKISADEVMQSKGFTYVPLADIINNAAEVDSAIGGSVERKGDLVKIEAMITNMKTQRFYSTIVEYREDQLDGEMRKTIKGLLKKALNADKVYADKFIDPKWSKVVYVVMSLDGREIAIEMDYTSDRPNPELQNVSILPPEGINKNGVTTLKVKSEEGGIIAINFNYKFGKLESVKVDTPVPDPSKRTVQSQGLTLKSEAGYLLEFDFTWKDGSMTMAKLSPKINPFGELEEARGS